MALFFVLFFVPKQAVNGNVFCSKEQAFNGNVFVLFFVLRSIHAKRGRYLRYISAFFFGFSAKF